MEEQRKQPEKAGSYCAGDTQRNKIGLEFSPSGSCFVNYRAEKHVVDNIPNSVDKIDDSLESQAYLKDVCDKAARICVDIEALRHIVDNICDRLFGSDIASVLINISAIVVITAGLIADRSGFYFFCQSITSCLHFLLLNHNINFMQMQQFC